MEQRYDEEELKELYSDALKYIAKPGSLKPSASNANAMIAASELIS